MPEDNDQNASTKPPIGIRLLELDNDGATTVVILKSGKTTFSINSDGLTEIVQ